MASVTVISNRVALSGQRIAAKKEHTNSARILINVSGCTIVNYYLALQLSSGAIIGYTGKGEK